MTYVIRVENKAGDRYWSHSYSSYGGNYAYLQHGEWTKLPASWMTREGAEKFKAGKSYMNGKGRCAEGLTFTVVPRPFTSAEKDGLVRSHGPALLEAARALYQAGPIDSTPEQWSALHRAIEACDGRAS